MYKAHYQTLFVCIICCIVLFALTIRLIAVVVKLSRASVRLQNGSYIAVGALAAGALMGSTALSLEVLVPLIKNIVSESEAANVAYRVNFTNMNGT